MKQPDLFDEEQIDAIELLTPTQARHMVEEELQISKTLYYDTLYPKIKNRIKAIGNNFRYQRRSMRRIPRYVVREIIRKEKAKFVEG
ncbi:MAG: hypothetical protein ACQETE_01655 [Bacteroidota bacterium]